MSPQAPPAPLDLALERAGLQSPSSEMVDQLDAAGAPDADDVLEVSRATWATETNGAEVLVVLNRESLVLVEMQKRGFFRPATPVAVTLRLGDYRDLGELDDADLPGPAVMFLAPDERDHFMLIWQDRRERDRMFAAMFDAHRGRYARWGLQLDPESYAADFDRYLEEIRANGPDDTGLLHDWLQQEYGDFDLTNALGLAVEWRRCELDDESGREPSARVMRISSPAPWNKHPEARRVIVRLGEGLYDKSLLGAPYDERSFGTGEPLHSLDAGPARLIALMTLAAYATAIDHPRAAEWAEAARTGIPAVPPSVFSDDVRAMWSQIGDHGPESRQSEIGV